MVSTIKKFGIIVFITVMGALNVSAQSENSKVIVLLNKASWCSVCQANDSRVKKDLMPILMQDKDVQLVVNDISNKDTKAASKPMLDKTGIFSFAKKNTGAGMLYFIDAKTKKLISSVSISKSNEEIMKMYKEALSKVDLPKHGEKGHVCDKSCKSRM